MPNIAHVSGENKRGVVYAGDETYVIEHDKRDKPELAGHMHLGMWMGGTRPSKEVDAGEYPFTEAYKALEAEIRFTRTEGCDILVRILTKEFMAFFADGSVEKATILFAPTECCGETMQVWRGGELFDECKIMPTGDPNTPMVFQGFGKVLGTDDGNTWRRKLLPAYFTYRDDLRIPKVPEGMTPQEYWREMTLEHAEPLDP